MPKDLVTAVSSKGQVTLPKPVRELLHVQVGDFIRFAPRERGVLLTKIHMEPERFSQQEWNVLQRLTNQSGRRYKDAKTFLKSLERP